MEGRAGSVGALLGSPDTAPEIQKASRVVLTCGPSIVHWGREGPLGSSLGNDVFVGHARRDHGQNVFRVGHGDIQQVRFLAG